jgi:hypothetical protein
MLTVFLLASLGLLVLSFGLVASVLFRLYRPCSAEEITPEWLENFSASAYYPMQGLLSDEDFRFLAGQPGFDLSLYRKLRRERMHIFRQYLRRLILDFNRLHLAARMFIASSQTDRSDLIWGLFLLKLKFSVAVLQAEISYGLCVIGFRTLLARTMIIRLEEMSAQLTQLAAPEAI